MMLQKVWGQSDLICTPHGALENWAYPIETQILKFWFLWVFIHPELRIKILRPVEKDLAQSDLPVLSYGQKTANFFWWKMLFFVYFFNIVSTSWLITSPDLRIEILRPIDKDLPHLDLLHWRKSQKIAFFIPKIFSFLAIAQNW